MAERCPYQEICAIASNKAKSSYFDGGLGIPSRASATCAQEGCSVTAVAIYSSEKRKDTTVGECIYRETQSGLDTNT